MKEWFPFLSRGSLNLGKIIHSILLVGFDVIADIAITVIEVSVDHA